MRPLLLVRRSDGTLVNSYNLAVLTGHSVCPKTNDFRVVDHSGAVTVAGISYKVSTWMFSYAKAVGARLLLKLD